MGALETNTTLIYGVHIRESANDGSDFSNAAADYRVAFLGEDGLWHFRDSAGAVTAKGAGGSEVDYVQATANVNVTATTEGTANTIVTGSAVTYDGLTSIMVEFFSVGVTPTATANAYLQLWLYDDAASIGEIAFVQTPAAAASYVPCVGHRRLTPSAAAHTYSIRGSVSGGTGVVSAGAGGIGAVHPMFIRITRV